MIIFSLSRIVASSFANGCLYYGACVRLPPSLSLGIDGAFACLLLLSYCTVKCWESTTTHNETIVSSSSSSTALLNKFQFLMRLHHLSLSQETVSNKTRWGYFPKHWTRWRNNVQVEKKEKLENLCHALYTIRYDAVPAIIRRRRRKGDDRCLNIKDSNGERICVRERANVNANAPFWVAVFQPPKHKMESVCKLNNNPVALRDFSNSTPLFSSLGRRLFEKLIEFQVVKSRSYASRRCVKGLLSLLCGWLWRRRHQLISHTHSVDRLMIY